MSLCFACGIHLAEAVRVSDLKLAAGECLWVSEDWLEHQEIALTSQYWKGADQCECT